MTTDRYPYVDDRRYDTVEDWSRAMRASRRRREWTKWSSRIIGAAVLILWLRLVGLCLAAGGATYTILGCVMVLATLAFLIVGVLVWMLGDERDQ